MTVVASNKFGWILSSDFYLKNVYKETKVEGNIKSFEFNSVFFDIKTPFKKKSMKNRKNSGEGETDEAGFVRNAYENLLELFKKSMKNVETGDDLQSAKVSADDFYNNRTKHPEKIPFHGGNNSNEPLVTAIENENYLIPGNSFFYCDDIREIDKYFKNDVFDFILMDPPWWNKYIRRKRKKNQSQGYGMLYNEELKKVNINKLLHDDGLLAVWCTNAPSHIDFIKSDLFPAWGIEYVSQWFWMKVTTTGLLICDFSQPLGKQPYERLIFGVKNNFKRRNPEENKIIMSIPSAIHSQKPPLLDLIKNYLPENSKTLELFARYLLPNCTSFGNEVLKLQHITLYKEVIK